MKFLSSWLKDRNQTQSESLSTTGASENGWWVGLGGALLLLGAGAVGLAKMRRRQTTTRTSGTEQ